MYKIVENDGKFKIKEVNEEGSTLRLLEQSFDTQAEAEKYVASLSGDDADKQPNDSQPVETASGSDVQPEEGPVKTLVGAFMESHADMTFPYTFTEADIESEQTLFDNGYRAGDEVADIDQLDKALRTEGA